MIFLRVKDNISNKKGSLVKEAKETNKNVKIMLHLRFAESEI